MEKQTTAVRVAGREYTLVSSDAPAHLHRVAMYVDRKITETAYAARMNKENAAVLAALNIADELIKAHDENARLRRALNELHREEK